MKSAGRTDGYALEVAGWRVVFFEEELLQAAVGEAVEEDGAGGQAIAAGAADLLVVGFDAMPGRATWMTVRTSALSTPMPKATVATTTSSLPERKARWTRSRVVGSRPAW